MKLKKKFFQEKRMTNERELLVHWLFDHRSQGSKKKTLIKSWNIDMAWQKKNWKSRMELNFLRFDWNRRNFFDMNNWKREINKGRRKVAINQDFIYKWIWKFNATVERNSWFCVKATILYHTTIWIKLFEKPNHFISLNFQK
jgi:hypothetical protein